MLQGLARLQAIKAVCTQTGHVALLQHGEFVMVHAAGSLFKACVDGDASYVELLINNGMSPSTCDYNQRTPLHLAASNGHTHIVHFLCNQAVGLHCCT